MMTCGPGVNGATFACKGPVNVVLQVLDDLTISTGLARVVWDVD